MTFNWKNKVILVAEDEPANYLFIEKIVHPTHATLIRAMNGAEAVEMVSVNPKIDMVLMDIYMPGVNGFEAALKIREIRPELPIVAQTCYENQIARDKVELSCFDDYVRKPININKLLVIIEKHLKPMVRV
jgi:two-component system, cell cycle response regulator DivK